MRDISLERWGRSPIRVGLRENRMSRIGDSQMAEESGGLLLFF